MDAVTFAPLSTERLVLRAFRAEDAPSLHRLINDWQVCRDLAAVPFPYARAEADRFIAEAAAGLAEGRSYHLAIIGQEAAAEVLVGGISMHVDPPERVAEIGYWVGRRFWGHGVATEAVRRLAGWALANLDLDRVMADAATDNGASHAVLRRVGFRHVGEGVELFVARGGEHKVLRFELSRDDLFGVPESEADAAVPEPPPPPAPVKASAKSGKKLLLVAACALIDSDGRVLLARRPEGKKMAGLWEFPGGKLDPGETPEAALRRELKEELGIDVTRACLAPFAFASHGYDTFHLLMPLFLCRRWKGRVEPLERQTLAWVRPDKLAEYPMPAADRPLVPLLRDFL